MTSQLAPQEAEVEQRLAPTSFGRASSRPEGQGRHGTGSFRSCRSKSAAGRAGHQPGPRGRPRELKAELRIPETQTRDLRIGQLAEVDTRNGVVKGRVSRIDPAAIGGTVGVDVILEDDLPAGARPDQSVDGTVTARTAADVIKVGRPAIGQENATITLFKLTADGHAVQTRGRTGAQRGERHRNPSGLEPGDQVILSDMSAHDAFDRIRIVN
jgi:HlyD family secretion protein